MTEHEFYRFLGKARRDEYLLLDFLKERFDLDPNVNVEVKEFPNRCNKTTKDIYLRFYNAGICLCFESEALVAIEVYTVKDKSYKNAFQDRFPEYKLPHNLVPSMTIKEVVKILGEPDRKGSDRFLPIWISYDSLGVEINFSNSDWNDGDNQISYISFFLPS